MEVLRPWYRRERAPCPEEIRARDDRLVLSFFKERHGEIQIASRSLDEINRASHHDRDWWSVEELDRSRDILRADPPGLPPTLRIRAVYERPPRRQHERPTRSITVLPPSRADREVVPLRTSDPLVPKASLSLPPRSPNAAQHARGTKAHQRSRPAQN